MSPFLYICLMSSSSTTLYNPSILTYFPALNTMMSVSELYFLRIINSAYHLFQEAFFRHNPDLNESPSFEPTCIMVLIVIGCNYNSYSPTSNLPQVQSVSMFKQRFCELSLWSSRNCFMFVFVMFSQACPQEKRRQRRGSGKTVSYIHRSKRQEHAMHGHIRKTAGASGGSRGRIKGKTQATVFIGVSIGKLRQSKQFRIGQALIYNGRLQLPGTQPWDD